jgi:hypothetical protein
MDLALALVAEDHGDKVALQVARSLVMYLKRPGGQSQFNVPLSLQEPSCDRIGALRTWIADNIREDLSLDVLADRVHLSVADSRYVAASTLQNRGLCDGRLDDAVLMVNELVTNAYQRGERAIKYAFQCQAVPAQGAGGEG